MAAANREAVAAKGSAAKRGRLSARGWADVRQAARVAREEGVTLKVCKDGIEVTGLMKQQRKVSKIKPCAARKPTEAVAQKQPAPAAADEASPPPPSKRKARSAQRLEDFQEKKRAAYIAKYIAACGENSPDLAPEEALQRATLSLAKLERSRLGRLRREREAVREAARDLPERPADAAPADSPMDEDRNAKRGAELEPPHGAGKKSRG